MTNNNLKFLTILFLAFFGVSAVKAGDFNLNSMNAADITTMQADFVGSLNSIKSYPIENIAVKNINRKKPLEIPATQASAVVLAPEIQGNNLQQNIIDVFEARKSYIAGKIREKRPMYEDASDEEIFSSRNCEPVSRLFHELLSEARIITKLTLARRHTYLEFTVLESGKEVDYVIDTTYRQFYTVGLIQKYGPENYKFNPKDLEGMPWILIVPKNELRSVLSSFPLKPEWEVEIPLFGFPSEFSDWYEIE